MYKKLICLAAVVLVLALVSDASAALMGHYKLHETSGSIADDASNNNDGTVMTGYAPGPVASPGWLPTDGRFGGALNLDGAAGGERVHVDGISIGASQAFTYSLWFNPDTTLDSSSARVDFVRWASGGPVYFVFQKTANSGTIELRGILDGWKELTGAQTTVTSWAAGTWHHIAGTYDGAGNYAIYVNGSLNDTANVSGATAAGTDLGFGGRRDGGGVFDGQMDDVGFYNHALSASDISTIYASGIPEPATIALLGLGGLVLLRRRK